MPGAGSAPLRQRASQKHRIENSGKLGRLRRAMDDLKLSIVMKTGQLAKKEQTLLFSDVNMPRVNGQLAPGWKHSQSGKRDVRPR